jgi:hypothetical protein
MAIWLIDFDVSGLTVRDLSPQAGEVAAATTCRGREAKPTNPGAQDLPLSVSASSQA